MRKVFVFLTIIIALLAAIAILPSFKISAFGRDFIFPEIDYSKYLKAESPFYLDYKKGKDFGKYTSLKFLVLPSDLALQNETVPRVARIMKQRLDVMEIVEGEVSHYKEDGSYYIQVNIPGTGEAVGKYLSALSNNGELELWVSVRQIDEDQDGIPDMQPSFSQNPLLEGYQPSGVTSGSFRSASMTVNSSYKGYTIKVHVDKSDLPEQASLGILSQETWVVVANDMPVAYGAQVASKQNIIYEFIPYTGDGSRQNVLSTLSLFSTNTYPEDVILESENVLNPDHNEKDLIMFAFFGIIILCFILIYTYFKYKKAFIFLTLSLAIFCIYTLFLFKLPYLDIKITTTLLLSFLLSIVFAFSIFVYLVNTVSFVLQDRSNRENKKVDEVYKVFRAQVRLFLIFALFLLVIFNFMHADFFRQFVNGFGFGLVVLLFMVQFVLKPYLKTFYGNFNEVFGKFAASSGKK